MWQLTKRELQALIRLVDSDYNGVIDIEEFELLVAGKDVLRQKDRRRVLIPAPPTNMRASSRTIMGSTRSVDAETQRMDMKEETV